LEVTGKATTLDETISTLGAGQSKAIPLTLTARQGGKFGFQVAAAGEGRLAAVPQSATVTVKEAQLSLSVHGPARGYVGQEATWELVVRNTGEVPMTGIVVKATLPPEIGSAKASDGGRVAGKQVVWDVGTAPPRREKPLTLTGICNNPAHRAVVTATASGKPDGGRDGATRPAPAAKPVEAAVEIVGVPALQLSVKDSKDPAPVGDRVTYTVRVKNAGTLAARKVEVVADLPAGLKPTRGTGPGREAVVNGPKVTFPALDALAPGAEATFVIEAEARLPGDARVAVEVRTASQAQALHALEPTRIIAGESRPLDR
jgi:uncharacterized repeat protein (TIGR01451 family)